MSVYPFVVVTVCSCVGSCFFVPTVFLTWSFDFNFNGSTLFDTLDSVFITVLFPGDTLLILVFLTDEICLLTESFTVLSVGFNVVETDSGWFFVTDNDVFGLVVICLIGLEVAGFGLLCIDGATVDVLDTIAVLVVGEILFTDDFIAVDAGLPTVVAGFIVDGGSFFASELSIFLAAGFNMSPFVNVFFSVIFTVLVAGFEGLVLVLTGGIGLVSDDLDISALFALAGLDGGVAGLLRGVDGLLVVVAVFDEGVDGLEGTDFGAGDVVLTSETADFVGLDVPVVEGFLVTAVCVATAEGLDATGLLVLLVGFNDGFAPVLVPTSIGFFDAKGTGFLEVAATFFGACFESKATAAAVTVATPTH